MGCPFCDEPFRKDDRCQYRGLPGIKGQPKDWASAHLSCARKAQEDGAWIHVRWSPSRSQGLDG